MIKVIEYMEPATAIVRALGGVRPLAREIATVSNHKINPSTISRWMRPTGAKGTGGKIPVKHWAAIQRVADKDGKKEEVERLLRSHADIALGRG